MESVTLMLTGGSTADDNAFLKDIQSRIGRAGLKDSVIFHKDFENEGRHEFFSKVSVISVPVLEGEAFGMYLLESMASGVPVVQPSLGAFPEIIGLSGGGSLFEPNTPQALAKSLEDLALHPEKLKLLSSKAREGVKKHFNTHDQASKMLGFYDQIKAKKKG